MNAEFQRRARKEKKALLSDQCKEIEENIRMGKTRDLVKKIRDTAGTFHAKMGTIKDRNGMDLTEGEDIKKRWQDYTKEDSTHGHHQMGNTKIRPIIFFAAKDRGVLYSQQNRDWELTVAQVINSLLANSDLN